MSMEGIHKFAKVLSMMQETRNELLHMGTKPGVIDKQDIRLGQLLEVAKDAVKDDFNKITMEK